MMRSPCALPFGPAGVALALAAATLALVVVWAHPGPAAAAPGNDNRANATIITSLPFINPINASGATLEAEETSQVAPNPAALAPPCVVGPKSGFGGTVWYRISTASATVPGTVLTADTAGSSYDTFIQVWRRIGGGGLADLGACRDDVLIDPGPPPVISLQAITSFAVNPDTIYFIQVGRSALGVLPNGSNLAFSLTGAATLAQFPIADDFADSTDKNTLLPITLTGTDPSGCAGTYTFQIVSQPANGGVAAASGAATCTGPGDLSAVVFYTPDTGFGGDDPFTFRFKDGLHLLDSNTATVTVTVINNPPVANDVNMGDVDGNSSNNPWTPSVSDPNGDTLTCTITAQPAHGSATVASNCSSGAYTPTSGFSGGDSFTYQVSDGSLTDPGTVSVNVLQTIAPGDANCDGVVNTVDGLIILQADVQLRGISDTCAVPFIATSPVFRGGADANCDGQVNTIDGLRVLQFDVGLITVLCP